MGEPAITVIVCTRDRPSQLEHCLNSLKLQTYPRFDVLVVDNASVHSLRELCLRCNAGYVREPVTGLSRARNTGARIARGELVAYIDDDAIAEAGWLAALAREFAEAGVAAVCGKYRYMKTLGDSADMSGDEATEGITFRPRGIFDRNSPDWFASACFGGIGEGSNMAFRRELLAQPFGFDERLGRGQLINGGEESVMFLSLIERGYRIVRAPEAVIRHPYPSKPELQRALRLTQLRTAIAHALFLWFEFPRYRRDILRHLGRAVRKRVTGSIAAQAPIRLSRWQTVRALLGGADLYWKARREMGRLC